MKTKKNIATPIEYLLHKLRKDVRGLTEEIVRGLADPRPDGELLRQRLALLDEIKLTLALAEVMFDGSPDDLARLSDKDRRMLLAMLATYEFQPDFRNEWKEALS